MNEEHYQKTLRISKSILTYFWKRERERERKRSFSRYTGTANKISSREESLRCDTLKVWTKHEGILKAFSPPSVLTCDLF